MGEDKAQLPTKPSWVVGKRGILSKGSCRVQWHHESRRFPGMPTNRAEQPWYKLRTIIQPHPTHFSQQLFHLAQQNLDTRERHLKKKLRRKFFKNPKHADLFLLQVERLFRNFLFLKYLKSSSPPVWWICKSVYFCFIKSVKNLFVYTGKYSSTLTNFCLSKPLRQKIKLLHLWYHRRTIPHPAAVLCPYTRIFIKMA